MNRARLAGAAFFAFASIPAASAEPRLFVIDGFNAALTFSCNVVGMVPIEGAFTRFVAVIVFDAEAPGEARAVVRVDADSLSMDQASLIEQMKGPEFFDVAHHPEFDFTSSRARVLAPGRLRIEGELSLRGITRPFALDVGYDTAGAPPTIEAFGSLDRTEYGMTAYDLVLSDAVSIEVEGRMDRSIAPAVPFSPGG